MVTMKEWTKKEKIYTIIALVILATFLGLIIADLLQGPKSYFVLQISSLLYFSLMQKQLPFKLYKVRMVYGFGITLIGLVYFSNSYSGLFILFSAIIVILAGLSYAYYNWRQGHGKQKEVN